MILKQFVPLTHEPGLRVALGAECAADQDAFEPYHAAAVERVPASTWRDIGEGVAALDLEAFERCVRGATFASEIEQSQ